MDSSQSETQVIKPEAYLVVESWSSDCGVCGYGGVRWSGGTPVTPDSTECPSCGVKFTHVRTECMYRIGKPEIDVTIEEWKERGKG